MISLRLVSLLDILDVPTFSTPYILFRLMERQKE